jgi:4-aminobutyrate aminotransferase/(S)-3-amino-2-methylpropionate transaminase
MPRAHEKWGLSEPPDYVTFAKKLLTGGYFFKGDEVVEVLK